MEKRASPKPRARILLVDDHPLIRERLSEIINAEPDLLVCGEGESRIEALEAIETTKPDLAIVDLTLRESHGLELIKDVQVRFPELFILVVSMHDESLYAERVIRAGARGYITKQEATRDILRAIRRVLSGQLYLSGEMAMHIASRILGHPRTTGNASVESLTDRELEVFELIGHGQSNRQIAESLGLDPKTVETYRARIKEKLDLKDGAALLRAAMQTTRGSTAKGPIAPNAESAD